VKAIGLSGQMHGSVFLNSQFCVLRPAILWNDQRTASECQEIETRAGGRRQLLRYVANPALAGFTAPKILWVRNHEPRIFDRTRHILLPKDEIRRRLTGDLATDVSDASGTLLFDVVGRCWSRELLAKLELDSRLLPACFESVEFTGKLLPDVARDLGLTSSCRVVAGAGDCAANALGTGIVAPGDVSSSIGTSGVVFAYADRPRVDPRGRLHTFCHAVPGKWHLMGVSLSAGGAWEWFVNSIVKANARRTGFEMLTQEAARVPLGSDGLYFLPYLAGERTPHADPQARGCWIGLTLRHTRGHLARSVLEGVCYALRDSLQIMHTLKIPVRAVRASGGGAKSRLWRQLQADILGERVVTLNVEEGPALGVALLAAVAQGEFKDLPEACHATLRIVARINPRRIAKSHYDRAFPEYQQLYWSLRKDFSRIQQLSTSEPLRKSPLSRDHS
jgi:xylulokinase